MSNTILTTEDNSHTLFSEHFGAHYHSIHGALEESSHVFISAGLYYQYQKKKTELRIFEMGMGSGLNLFMTYIEAMELDLRIHYHCIESQPISSKEAESLNFPDVLQRPHLRSVFNSFHDTTWEKDHVLAPNFTFRKSKVSIEEFNEFLKYDLIYFDAFAPSCQPELWLKPLHEKLYSQLDNLGCLVTYCSQGEFRRTLESVGYKIERLNGPGRKREMLRAIKY